MAMERVKRKLSAILCADVVEYARLMGEDEAATLNALNTCDTEIIEPTVKEHNGRIFKRLGDGFLVEFSSVVDSVECALAWQKQIREKNYPLQFRIGINLGDVIEQDDDVYGDGVNIAARIEKLADPGGVSISQDVFKHIRNKVSLGYEYLGEQQVKNISEPVGVYKILTNPEDAGKIIGEDKQVASKKFSSRQRIYAITAGILAFIVIAFFVGKLSYEPQIESVASEENMAYALPEEPSIAVMPFNAIGGSEDENLLSDGILTSLATALSKTPKLFTVDYASTSKYKGEDISIKDVAEELSVRYVLLGDLQKSGDQVRINVKLIDALTGKSIWAEKYDRSIDDLFAMQDDITMQVMKALQVELYEGEYGNVIARGTDNLEAYLKIVQGYQYWQGGNAEDDAIAQRLAIEAIKLDPEYSAAYGLLSRTLWRQVVFRTTKNPDKAHQEALDAALKALELDYSADTLSQLGWVYKRMGQIDKAIETAEKGLALNPNNSRALTNTGMVLMPAGRCEEAMGLLDKALRISPIPSVNILFVAAQTRFQCKQYDECIELAKKATALGPNSFLAHRELARCNAMAGRLEEAKASASEVLRIFPKYKVKDASKFFAYNEKAQEVAARFVKSELMAGLPPDKSLKNAGESSSIQPASVEDMAFPLPSKPSVAVLPFENFSDDPRMDKFVDGFTGNIITLLSKVPQLFVISSTSTFAYKGKPIKVQQVAEELGVQYVLEGSVQKSEKRMRIAVQFIDALEGHHLWAERYDQPFEDMFDIQDQIALNVCSNLRVLLSEGEQDRLVRGMTRSFDAWELYLQAESQRMLFTKESEAKARDLLQQSLAIDPDYVDAWIMLASTHTIDARFGYGESREDSLQAAEEALNRALTLDDNNSTALGHLGTLHLWRGEHDKAIIARKKALAINPNNSNNIRMLAWAMFASGEPEEALVLIQQAMRLNPSYPSSWLMILQESYRLSGRYDEAIETIHEELRRHDHFFTRTRLALYYAQTGRDDEARAEIAKVLQLNPNMNLQIWAKAQFFKNKDWLDRDLADLKRVGLPEKAPQAQPNGKEI